ncbi:MAG: anthranilate synthase component II [Bacteroidales bacterium]
MKKILILDNYDSFTYNLFHLVNELGYTDVDVYRNDQISLESVEKYDKIILSPGPGVPSQAGILIPLIEKYAKSKSILGVCLGHQAIGSAFGADLINLKEVYHGISSPIQIIVNNDILFEGLPSDIEVGRYHSWAVDTTNLPEDLIVTAVDQEGIIMGLRHRTYDVHGIQFHPESVLTPQGKVMLSNFLMHLTK